MIVERNETLPHAGLGVQVAQQQVQADEEDDAEEDGPLDDVAFAGVPPGAGDAVVVYYPAVGDGVWVVGGVLTGEEVDVFHGLFGDVKGRCFELLEGVIVSFGGEESRKL